ncbi:MAG TPA: hypothetical protein VGL08_05870 [Paraburkholderia sp.]|jgi:hypothetical protein
MEQKNGSVVRRLVGYGSQSGADTRNALAQLYASSRLYINFFQRSFKLKSKTRDGARVHKVYLAPATPCDRLLAHDRIDPTIKESSVRSCALLAYASGTIVASRFISSLD